jgi:hypothetical protein
MARIYFDSNVFSNLRKAEQAKYIVLKDAIKRYRNNLLFIFSHAHIRDKINDDSDFKFADFEFMKTLVEDNYLSYHALNKNTCFYLANPLEVFQDNDSLDDINFVMEIMGSYKTLRTLIENAGEAITLKDEIYNRNDLFKAGELQEKFIDFIKASLYHQDKSKIPYYDFYLHSYAILDMLGFSKDKLNKKNSFNNIFNDSLHSYYARYCDYLVTEDMGLKTKSSMLYKHYEATTKILSVEEFIESIELIGSNTENSLLDFFNNLAKDLNIGTILSKDDEINPTVFTILPQHKYFNFFDLLQVIKSPDNGIYIFISKLDNHYLSGANFREKQFIIDKMLGLFGNDLYKGTVFDFEIEVEEIRSKSWKGRYWEVGDTQINAHVNSTSKEFCVQIGPFTRWIYLSRFKS